MFQAEAREESSGPFTFLVSTPDYKGHLMRALEVAQGLVARGHRVLVHAPASTRASTERAGARLIPYRDYLDPHERAFRFRQAAPRWLKWFPPYHAWKYTQLALDGAAQLARELEPLLREERVDCVVYDYFSVGANYAAELVGIPSVTTGNAVSVVDDNGLPILFDSGWVGTAVRRFPWAVHAVQDMLMPLARVRAELGLPPREDKRAELYLSSASDQLHIAMVHRGLLPSRPLRPRQIFAGTVSFDGEGGNQKAEDADFVPPVPGSVLIASTTLGEDGGLMLRVLKALAPLGIPLIVTTGDVQELSGSWGPHVRIERYVPHEKIFPHIAAVVSHGGWGVVSRALRHGVPMLAIPLFGDHPLNSRMLADRGLGYHLPLKQATPERIRERLQALLVDKPLHERLKQGVEELRALRGSPVIFQELERVAREARGSTPTRAAFAKSA